MKPGFLKRELWIRIGFAVFLFIIGYLVGAGIGKTVHQLTKSGKQAVLILPGTPGHSFN